MAREVVKQSR